MFEGRRLTPALRALAVTLAGLLALEALLRGAYALRNASVDVVPLPYAIGDEYGPVPPWLDGLRILVPDDELLWRGRPNARRRYVDVFSPAAREDDRRALLGRLSPALPEELRASPTWSVELDSEGFREDELPARKDPGALRVVCLGDSWTFGANVDVERTYPRRLAALLRAARPGRRVEVLNLGVLGYSSFQGRRLLERRALALEPDVVVIAYAMNDARVPGFRDRDLAEARGALASVGAALGASEVLKLARYLALRALDRRRPLDEQLRELARRDAQAPADYAALEPWVRVGPADYEANLERMVGLARERGAGALLLFNELDPASPYRAAMERVAARTGAGFVDASALVARARSEREANVARALGLHPPGCEPYRNGGRVDVVLRVSAARARVPERMYVASGRPELGAGVPNRWELRDDGTLGDERARDGVWSRTASLPRGARLDYVYTNSGPEGEWQGLDVPAVRALRVDAPEGCDRLYAPVETFGQVYLQADAWHTDAEGYGRIAAAVRDALAPLAPAGAPLD
jgi:lysophospholipase L1-like esterase